MNALLGKVTRAVVVRGVAPNLGYADFLELRWGEVRRIRILSSWVNSLKQEQQLSIVAPFRTLFGYSMPRSIVTGSKGP